MKEIRFGPQTDDHDYNFKLKHAIGFLQDGDKVKAYVFFKGRSILFKEQGEVLLLRFANDLEDYAKVEQMPLLEGKRMTIQLSPKKKEAPKKPVVAKPAAPAQKAEMPEPTRNKKRCVTRRYSALPYIFNNLKTSKMPKMKTNSGSKKRFTLTGTGKIKRKHAFHSHILTKKSKKRKRNLCYSTTVDTTNVSQVKELLAMK